MKSLRYVLPVLAALAIFSLADKASAQCGGYGVGNGWFGNLNAYGGSGTLYGSGYLYVPPYFAVHPPVYYSHQYYRPYGWSPFAQGANMTPALVRPQPQLVMNPHLPAAKAKPAADNTARAEWTINPYFVSGQKPGQGRLASSETR